MISRVVAILMVSISVVGMWSCNGCPSGRGVQPTLAFNQSWPSLNPVDLASGLHNGTIAFNDVSVVQALQPTQCTFFADLVAGPASLQANGNPPDANFNLAFAVFNLHKAGAACPSNSPSPSEIVIAPSRGLVVGQTTTIGDARFVVGGQRFSTTRGYFEFTLVSFDRGRGSMAGNFQAVAMNDSDPHDTRGLVITGGSMALPVH